MELPLSLVAGAGLLPDINVKLQNPVSTPSKYRTIVADMNPVHDFSCQEELCVIFYYQYVTFEHFPVK